MRQQGEKGPGIPNLAFSDFLAPKDSGRQDYIGGFAVTAGMGIEKLIEQFEADHDDYSSIMIKALADRLAEAFAERLHQRVREEFWGYAADEKLTNEELIQEKYRGVRPAPGYPGCPDHTEKITLFQLLDADQQTGIQPHRKPGHVPGILGERPLLRPPRLALLRPGQNSPRPGRGHRPAQKYADCRPGTLAFSESEL